MFLCFLAHAGRPCHECQCVWHRHRTTVRLEFCVLVLIIFEHRSLLPFDSNVSSALCSSR
jgi:hypothetical protein